MARQRTDGMICETRTRTAVSKPPSVGSLKLPNLVSGASAMAMGSVERSSMGLTTSTKGGLPSSS